MAGKTDPTDRSNAPAEGRDGAAGAPDSAVTDAAFDAAFAIDTDDVELKPDQPPASDPSDDLRKALADRDEYLDLLQRVRAEFANYQKRVKNELEQSRRFAAQPLASELLPVLDNIERALAAADSGNNAAALLDGIRLVQQQMLGTLARHGIEPIAALGEPFDPTVHEALVEQPAPDKPPGTVIQEYQKGYRLHDRVIRPARVVVSSAPPAITK